MRTITVAAAKGGVGKSTTAAAVGYELARLGHRVMLHDMDPQAGLTLALGIDPATDPHTAEPLAVELPGIEPGRLRLRPAGRRLMTARRTDVADLLKAGSDGTDVLICDCAPAVGSLTLGVIEHSDVVLVPLSPSAPDLQGLADIWALLREMSRPAALCAVLVRVQPRHVITREVRALVAERYPGVLLATGVPSDARVPEAPGHGMPVSCYAPRCRAALAYSELARELVKFLEP